MKKIVTLLLLALLSTGAFAQSPSFGKNELDLSYGLITAPQFIDVWKDILVTTFSFGTYQQENKHYTGGLFLTYKYALKDRWLLGFTAGYDGASGDLLNKDGNFKGDYVTSYVSTIASVDYRYLMRDKVQLYSGIGVGATLLSDKSKAINPDTNSEETDINNQVFFDFQINLIGVRVGKALAGFAELGVGYKGIINAGISYQF